MSQPIDINSSAIKVAGIGGLGMVAMVVIVGIAFPIARWLLLSGIAGGVFLAFALIARARLRRPGTRRLDLPIGLVIRQRPK